ncbi:hypothetical protein [Bacillus mycoides]|uniref:hypothetical protein n=1 Tax=Bacillus mycoides TaxID=1405 RepID=UPI001C031800|nr:hypothetical protein [Bacillus mycoides]QWI44708.1 hypothetical protein EXW55_17650 [Bacillus mycoides]
MAYVIQNVKTKKYLKHNGNYNPESYQFKDVDTKGEAEQYPSKEHADYVSMWHADMSETFQVIEI